MIDLAIEHIEHLELVDNKILEGKQLVTLQVTDIPKEDKSFVGLFLRGINCDIIILNEKSFLGYTDMKKFISAHAETQLGLRPDMNHENGIKERLNYIKNISNENISAHVYISFLRLFGMGKEESKDFYRDK